MYFIKALFFYSLTIYFICSEIFIDLLFNDYGIMN